MLFRSPHMSAINGFVRENLVQPLRNNSQKTDIKDSDKNNSEFEERQEIATDKSLSDVVNSREAKDVAKDELDETISQLNDSLQNVQRNLKFSVDQDAGKIVINVTDKETDEVVRQIPSEEVLELARNLQKASERLNGSIGDSRSQSLAEGVFLRTSV